MKTITPTMMMTMLEPEVGEGAGVVVVSVDSVDVVFSGDGSGPVPGGASSLTRLGALKNYD